MKTIHDTAADILKSAHTLEIEPLQLLVTFAKTQQLELLDAAKIIEEMIVQDAEVLAHVRKCYWDTDEDFLPCPCLKCVLVEFLHAKHELGKPFDDAVNIAAKYGLKAFMSKAEEVEINFPENSFSA